jgi:hypothetical protein
VVVIAQASRVCLSKDLVLGHFARFGKNGAGRRHTRRAILG